GYLQEILGISGIMLVKSFGRESAERQRFAAMNDQLRNLEVRQNLIGQWFGMLMSTLQTAGPALMILFGGWLVVTGRATVGTVFVFATVLGQRLAGSVTTLAGMHVNVTGSLALFGRLFAYIDRGPEISDSPGARALGPAAGGSRCPRAPFPFAGRARPRRDGPDGPRRAGPARRPRWSYRRGQDHDHRPGRPLSRPATRPDPARRHRPAPGHPRLAGPP